MRKLIVPLTENHLFSKAYTKGKCEVSKYFAVYLLRNFKKAPDGTPLPTKLGITVNRKLGKACKRNRVKRMIRQAYRDNFPLIKDGYLLVIAARAAAFAPYVKSTDLTKALHGILSKESFYDLKNADRKPNPKGAPLKKAGNGQKGTSAKMPNGKNGGKNNEKKRV